MRFSVPLLAKVNMGFRMWMPNLPMTLVSARSATATQNASAVFRVSPKMTKWEIREYLTKIYQLPVKNVNTMNYMGARKRVIGRRKIAYLKQKDFKKAIVTFEDSLLDVGIGTRIPELDQDDDADAVEGQI
mmetsp:Transcript_15328/g.21357  ORF Transcript_15328/g.21357 Transcript_15328/m.21357 type:complete len:131 (-) Transcript_15328:112-504(-)